VAARRLPWRYAAVFARNICILLARQRANKGNFRCSIFQHSPILRRNCIHPAFCNPSSMLDKSRPYLFRFCMRPQNKAFQSSSFKRRSFTWFASYASFAVFLVAGFLQFLIH
jgi:hypothetical protein